MRWWLRSACKYIYVETSNPGSSEALNYTENGKVFPPFISRVMCPITVRFKEKRTVGGQLVYMMRNELTEMPAICKVRCPDVIYRFFPVVLTYGFDSRYFFRFNFGYNGSERFAEKERFGFFPSARYFLDGFQ